MRAVELLRVTCMDARSPPCIQASPCRPGAEIARQGAATLGRGSTCGARGSRRCRDARSISREARCPEAKEVAAEAMKSIPHTRVLIAERYPLVETPSKDYRQRTRWNVRDSDAALILVPGELSGGSRLTAGNAR